MNIPKSLLDENGRRLPVAEWIRREQNAAIQRQADQQRQPAAQTPEVQPRTAHQLSEHFAAQHEGKIQAEINAQRIARELREAKAKEPLNAPAYILQHAPYGLSRTAIRELKASAAERSKQIAEQQAAKDRRAALEADPRYQNLLASRQYLERFAPEPNAVVEAYAVLESGAEGSFDLAREKVKTIQAAIYAEEDRKAAEKLAQHNVAKREFIEQAGRALEAEARLKD